MHFVQILDGKVVNRALFDGNIPEDWEDADSWIKNEEAQIGWNYDGEKFSPSQTLGPSLAEMWETLRAERNQKIQDTQWIAIRSITTGKEIPEDWILYWQLLRDLPETLNDPRKVVWPDQPKI